MFIDCMASTPHTTLFVVGCSPSLKLMFEDKSLQSRYLWDMSESTSRINRHCTQPWRRHVIETSHYASADQQWITWPVLSLPWSFVFFNILIRVFAFSYALKYKLCKYTNVFKGDKIVTPTWVVGRYTSCTPNVVKCFFLLLEFLKVVPTFKLACIKINP